jgi:hypothetical protein
LLLQCFIDPMPRKGFKGEGFNLLHFVPFR